MNEYIRVTDNDVNDDDVIEIPIESDGVVLLSTLAAQYPGVTGLKYKNKCTGAWRGIRLEDGKLWPPDHQNWEDRLYQAVFPKDKKKLEVNAFSEYRMLTFTEELIKCCDLIILGLPWSADENKLRDYFSKFGELVFAQIKRDVTGKSKGFGFIRFADYEAQLTCISQKHNIDGRTCEVRIPHSKVANQPQGNSKIHVGRVTEDISAEDLTNYFSRYGKVLEVFVPKPCRGFAFVTFADPEVAQKLIGEDLIIKNTSVRISCANAQPWETAYHSGGTLGGIIGSGNSPAANHTGMNSFVGANPHIHSATAGSSLLGNAQHHPPLQGAVTAGPLHPPPIHHHIPPHHHHPGPFFPNAPLSNFSGMHSPHLPTSPFLYPPPPPPPHPPPLPHQSFGSGGGGPLTTCASGTNSIVCSALTVTRNSSSTGYVQQQQQPLSLNHLNQHHHHHPPWPAVTNGVGLNAVTAFNNTNAALATFKQHHQQMLIAAAAMAHQQQQQHLHQTGGTSHHFPAFTSSTHQHHQFLHQNNQYLPSSLSAAATVASVNGGIGGSAQNIANLLSNVSLVGGSSNLVVPPSSNFGHNNFIFGNSNNSLAPGNALHNHQQQQQPSHQQQISTIAAINSMNTAYLQQALLLQQQQQHHQHQQHALFFQQPMAALSSINIAAALSSSNVISQSNNVHNLLSSSGGGFSVTHSSSQHHHQVPLDQQHPITSQESALISCTKEIVASMGTSSQHLIFSAANHHKADFSPTMKLELEPFLTLGFPPPPPPPLPISSNLIKDYHHHTTSGLVPPTHMKAPHHLAFLAPPQPLEATATPLDAMPTPHHLPYFTHHHHPFIINNNKTSPNLSFQPHHPPLFSPYPNSHQQAAVDGSRVDNLNNHQQQNVHSLLFPGLSPLYHLSSNEGTNHLAAEQQQQQQLGSEKVNDASSSSAFIMDPYLSAWFGGMVLNHHQNVLSPPLNNHHHPTLIASHDRHHHQINLHKNVPSSVVPFTLPHYPLNVVIRRDRASQSPAKNVNNDNCDDHHHPLRDDENFVSDVDHQHSCEIENSLFNIPPSRATEPQNAKANTDRQENSDLMELNDEYAANVEERFITKYFNALEHQQQQRRTRQRTESFRIRNNSISSSYTDSLMLKSINNGFEDDEDESSHSAAQPHQHKNVVVFQHASSPDAAASTATHQLDNATSGGNDDCPRRDKFINLSNAVVAAPATETAPPPSLTFSPGNNYFEGDASLSHHGPPLTTPQGLAPIPSSAWNDSALPALNFYSSNSKPSTPKSSSCTFGSSAGGMSCSSLVSSSHQHHHPQPANTPLEELDGGDHVMMITTYQQQQPPHYHTNDFLATNDDEDDDYILHEAITRSISSSLPLFEEEDEQEEQEENKADEEADDNIDQTDANNNTSNLLIADYLDEP